MKINLKTKIKYNGQEYSSVEEMPPEARSAYEKAIAAESATISTKIVFNEREYASPEQMPPRRASALRRCDEAGARHRRDRSRQESGPRRSADAGTMAAGNLVRHARAYCADRNFA